MRSRLNKVFGLGIRLLLLSMAFAQFTNVASANSFWSPTRGVSVCLELVRDPDRIRQLAEVAAAENVPVFRHSVQHFGPIKLYLEQRGAVIVATCKATLMPVSDLPLSNELQVQFRDLADKFDLLEIRLKVPGLFFADCQNAPHARYGLSVTPRDGGWVFQAVHSPAVGGPCGHSYGLH